MVLAFLSFSMFWFLYKRATWWYWLFFFFLVPIRERPFDTGFSILVFWFLYESICIISAH